MKTVAVYYSLEGTTRQMMASLKDEFAIDVVEIIPQKSVKTKGFSKFVWGGMQAVMKQKPELQAYDIDLSKYDTVIVGSPVWAGTFAPPLRTFFDQEEITGKNIIAICPHEGGLGKTESILEAEFLGKNKSFNFKDFSGAKNDIEGACRAMNAWIKPLITVD